MPSLRPTCIRSIIITGFFKFADDTYLVVPAVAIGTCHNEIDHLQAWAVAKNLKLNRDKTKEIVFSERRKVALPPPRPDIERMSSLRVLGVILNDKLTAADHVTALLSSGSSMLYAIRLCLPRHALLSLIRAKVVSKVDYCCSVTGSVLAGVSRQLLYRLQCSPFSTPLLDLYSPSGVRSASLRFSASFTLAAGSGTDNNPSLRSDTPLPQRISAGIPRREHSFDSRRGKPPSSTVVHNNNACRSAGAEIYPRWSCFPRRCTACMEQSTIISSNCFLPRCIQTPAEDISIRPQFWLTCTNFPLVIIL